MTVISRSFLLKSLLPGIEEMFDLAYDAKLPTSNLRYKRKQLYVPGTVDGVRTLKRRFR